MWSLTDMKTLSEQHYWVNSESMKFNGFLILNLQVKINHILWMKMNGYYGDFLNGFLKTISSQCKDATFIALKKRKNTQEYSSIEKTYGTLLWSLQLKTCSNRHWFKQQKMQWMSIVTA